MNVSTKGRDKRQDEDLRSRATGIEKSFRVTEKLFLLGTLETGVTVYGQQVRAHNLIWALHNLKSENGEELHIAIVGGGIGGLTAAAGVLSVFQRAEVTILEQRSDLCPIQQGCDSRWLHPRIYNWPELGSRSPSASLPLLNWEEGRASDVADQVLRSFGQYCERYAPGKNSRLHVYLEARDMRVEPSRNRITWKGNEAQRHGAFFIRKLGGNEFRDCLFDVIILAIGFGFEKSPGRYPTSSYWRNEAYAQPILDGGNKTYVISGFGDGALVDLFRLKIERFRQDKVLYDLFGKNLEVWERKFRSRIERQKEGESVFDLFTSLDGLDSLAETLTVRLRKDTRLILHLAGRDGAKRTFRDIFCHKSSVLNRLLLFLLFKANGFSHSREALDDIVTADKVPVANVLCRHGVSPFEHLRGLFSDWSEVEDRMETIRANQAQSPNPLWPAGFFPYIKE